MKLPRSCYFPKGTVQVKAKGCEAVAHVYEKAGRFYAAVFFGKQSKPYGHYWYKTAEQREAFVKRCFESRLKSEAFKAAEAAKRKAFVPSVKVGEIYRTCWGYEQTNVEFYEVVAFSGKTATLREVATESVATGWAMGKRVPLPGEYVGKEFKRRALPGGGFKITSCAYASLASSEVIAGVKVYKPAAFTSYA